MSIRPVGLVKIKVKLHQQAFRQNFENGKNAKIWFLFARPLKMFFSRTTQQNS